MTKHDETLKNTTETINARDCADVFNPLNISGIYTELGKEGLLDLYYEECATNYDSTIDSLLAAVETCKESGEVEAAEHLRDTARELTHCREEEIEKMVNVMAIREAALRILADIVGNHFANLVEDASYETAARMMKHQDKEV